MCREAASGTRCLSSPMGPIGTHRGRSAVSAGHWEVLILLILFFLFFCKHLEVAGVAQPQLSADTASPPEQPAARARPREAGKAGPGGFCEPPHPCLSLLPVRLPERRRRAPLCALLTKAQGTSSSVCGCTGFGLAQSLTLTAGKSIQPRSYTQQHWFKHLPGALGRAQAF